MISNADSETPITIDLQSLINHITAVSTPLDDFFDATNSDASATVKGKADDDVLIGGSGADNTGTLFENVDGAVTVGTDSQGVVTITGFGNDSACGGHSGCISTPFETNKRCKIAVSSPFPTRAPEMF